MRAQAHEVLKFSEKSGWHLKPRHFVVVEGIFLFPVFFKEKINFWKYLGGVQSFCRLFFKLKKSGKGNNA